MEDISSVKAGYNLWAPSYDTECNVLTRLETSQGFIRKNVILKLKTEKEFALDIGCGSGRHLAGLEADFENVVGIDLSENMLSFARTKCLKPTTELLCDDFLNHNFGDKKFDFINCSLALMHIRDLEKFISKVSSLLKPSGVFYLVDATEELLNRGSSPNFDRDGKNIRVAHEIHSFSDIRNLMLKYQLAMDAEGFIPFDPYIIGSDRKLIRYLHQDCLYFMAAEKVERS